MPSDDRAVRRWLDDIADHIALAQQFAEGMNRDGFCADLRALYAVIRCLEVILEASRRLPDALKAGHSSIPWRDVAASGNIYRHEYGSVSALAVWDTLTLHPPPPRTVVAAEPEALD